MILSPCCHAASYIENSDDLGPEGRAHWYVCSACDQPCDPQTEHDGDALDDSCCDHGAIRSTEDTRAKGGAL